MLAPSQDGYKEDEMGVKENILYHRMVQLSATDLVLPYEHIVNFLKEGKHRQTRARYGAPARLLKKKVDFVWFSISEHWI